MNSKEKAQQIVDNMYKVLTKGFTDNDLAQILANSMWLNEAKQCALICVEEIINDNPNIYDSDRLNHKYWKKVLTEIENYE